MSGFKYADASLWQEWQREYRFGAFYIFPPPGIIEPIDELRQTYDPTSASYCQAHISLSEALSGPLTDVQVKELRAALSTLDPLELAYGPLCTFPPYPGVAYTIRPVEPFINLRSLIHATPLFDGVSLSRKDIAPHMTIAEFITLERTDELLGSLSGKAPEGTFPCRSIEYAVPNQSFCFERVLTLGLGATG